MGDGSNNIVRPFPSDKIDNDTQMSSASVGSSKGSKDGTILPSHPGHPPLLNPWRTFGPELMQGESCQCQTQSSTTKTPHVRAKTIVLENVASMIKINDDVLNSRNRSQREREIGPCTLHTGLAFFQIWYFRCYLWWMRMRTPHLYLSGLANNKQAG